MFAWVRCHGRFFRGEVPGVRTENFLVAAGAARVIFGPPRRTDAELFMNAEQSRLDDDRDRKAYWRRWGPYLSERQWGTVREDYSATGEAWDYFPHDHARSRVYRWGEDGILGISDNHQRLCFAFAFWNGRDPILKERMFGLTGSEGNHGEDVKEYYFYLDSTPTHSYSKGLYKYPQAAFPYEALIQENHRRGKDQLEFELLDTGVFDDNRYFDVFVEYAKENADDVLVRVSVTNRGPEPAELHLLPTLWFRNTWDFVEGGARPSLRLDSNPGDQGSPTVVRAGHPTLGTMLLVAEPPQEVLFTDNETNFQRIFGSPNSSAFQKDGIERFLLHGENGAVNPAHTGTKTALHYRRTLAAGETWTVKLRLMKADAMPDPGASLQTSFDATFANRLHEADEFYGALAPDALDEETRSIQRQAFAGMLWNKQFYHYVVERWLNGDPTEPPPPAARLTGRNSDWRHLFNDDVLSLPDTWEFPWFASWDLAFHTLPLALIDPEFAKRQLMLLTREWYMHPNGQLPAYEWAFGDVNPPVHAWGAWRVYTIERKARGGAPDAGDRMFLERVFQKLLMNFTWWVNRKDAQDRNIFQGGFLGLDNIGVFDRSQPLPTGGTLEQSDATSWMAMYALNLLKIALELALYNPVYEDIASKFFEHFLSIAHAMSSPGGGSLPLWNDEDGLFYDHIRLADGGTLPLKIHSMVSLIPLFAVEVIESDLLKRLPGFGRRFDWFMKNRPELTGNISQHCQEKRGGKLMLSIVNGDMLRKILRKMLDENEFLSPYGIRSVSKYHEHNPYELNIGGTTYRVDYNPGESRSGLFGGNSNWRGPIWMPVNYLLIESLQKFHYYFGDEYKVECPVGSGQMLTLWEVAAEISRRLLGIFRRDPATGRRPVFGPYEKFQRDPEWNPYPFFHEYFHADEGRGCGASHQTGWTGLIAKLLQQTGEYDELGTPPQP